MKLKAKLEIRNPKSEVRASAGASRCCWRGSAHRPERGFATRSASPSPGTPESRPQPWAVQAAADCKSALRSHNGFGMRGASAARRGPGGWLAREAVPAVLAARGQTRQGFTLIELLLVLVILGILAAIVVPKFAGRTEQARVTAAQTQISNFGSALDAYEVDMGSYPKGKNGLAELVQAPRDAQSWKGPYLKGDVPLDPWGHPYIYECPGKQNPGGYDLMSMGPDGRTGTEDDVSNWQTQKR